MPQIALRDDDGTLTMLRDSIAGFAKQNPGPPRLRAERNARRGIAPAIWKQFAEAGWIGLLLPEDAGGPGLTIREQVIVSEALGRALAPEPYATLSVFAPALLAGATRNAERDRLCAGIISGGAIVSVAWQDKAAPAGAEPASTKAVARDGGWSIDGAKVLVDASGAATDFLVVAETEGTAALFYVPSDTAGLTVTSRPGIDGSEIAEIALGNCRVDDRKLLQRAATADALLRDPIQDTRLAIAAELSGLAGKALELTIGYTSQRVQFGKPIASFQVIQHRLVDMWMQAELAGAAVRNAVELRCKAATPREIAIATFAAKARAADAAMMICRNAIHLYGAMGYTDECDIGLYLKRAINLGAMLGNSDTMRRLFLQAEQTSDH